VKSSIPHGTWGFHFILFVKFLKLEYALGFLSNAKVNLVKIPQEMPM
jgi:hypothetical protein